MSKCMQVIWERMPAPNQECKSYGKKRSIYMYHYDWTNTKVLDNFTYLGIHNEDSTMRMMSKNCESQCDIWKTVWKYLGAKRNRAGHQTKSVLSCVTSDPFIYRKDSIILAYKRHAKKLYNSLDVREKSASKWQEKTLYTEILKKRQLRTQSTKIDRRCIRTC